MSVFTKRTSGDLSKCNSISVKLDSKGRISIPSFLRKNLALVEGVELELIFDLRKNCFLVSVQNGVVGSTSDCECTSFFRKERPTLERNYNTKNKQTSLSLSSNLSSGLKKLKGGIYER